MPEEYNIGSGLTDAQLNVASFWVRNKLILRKIGFGMLIVLSAVLWIYILWVLVDAYIISYPRESRIPATISRALIPVQVQEALAPKDLALTTPIVLQTTENRLNIISSVENPNPQWYATLSFHFDLGGIPSPTQSTVILPSSSRWIGEFGYTPSSTSRTAELKVDSLVWNRIRPDMVEQNYEAFAQKRLSLTAKNIAFVPEKRSATGTVEQAHTTFTLSNPSGFGFWSVDLVILLQSQGRPVTTARLVVENVKPGEERPISIDWTESVGGINQTLVAPYVNILDQEIYLPTSRF